VKKHSRRNGKEKPKAELIKVEKEKKESQRGSDGRQVELAVC